MRSVRWWLITLALLMPAFEGGLSDARPASAAACRPPGSPAMLTGPVWEAIAAECRWVDAQSRRDAASAAQLLVPEFTRIDAAGGLTGRDATLQRVRAGSLGPIAMNVNTVRVTFSSGSTNVVVATWRAAARTYRVMDVYFCNVTAPQCVYRLVAEQLTTVGGGTPAR